MNPIQSSLPLRLKLATRELHTRAERSGVMADLLKRRISRKAYVALLTNLHAVYAALESGLAANEQGLSKLLPLARTAALAADLRAFSSPVAHGAPAAAALPLEDITLAYVERLHMLRGGQGHRLWSHAYVRYLGDLHGGQVLSQLVDGLFGVEGGTRFYEFGSEDEVLVLRASLRAQLASAPLNETQTAEVEAEAVWAFEAHCTLFEAIQARCR